MIRTQTDSLFAAHAGPQVFHAFFTRSGGVSTGIYAGLNCAPASADSPACIAENRARAAAEMGVAPERLLTLRQTHSAMCHLVRDPWPPGTLVEGDALVTDRPGLALGVLTADCAPVLLAGRGNSGPVIGAVHAGWKGAIGGVLESGLAAMESLGASRQSLCAVIGPCIARDSYEVGGDFRADFLAHDPENTRFFKPRADSFTFDLPAYVAHRLTQAGLVRIFTTGQDTCAQEDDFFSFRRATQAGQADYGRQISAILIRPAAS